MPFVESMTFVSRPGDNTGVGTQVATIDSNGVTVTSPAVLKQDSSIVQRYRRHVILVGSGAATQLVDLIRVGRWRLAGVIAYAQTGGTSPTFTITVESGTTAPGSGTAQLTAVISLAAAVATVPQNGTLITTPTVAGPGDRFSLLVAGTIGSLANGIVEIDLERIS